MKTTFFACFVLLGRAWFKLRFLRRIRFWNKFLQCVRLWILIFTSGQIFSSKHLQSNTISTKTFTTFQILKWKIWKVREIDRKIASKKSTIWIMLLLENEIFYFFILLQKAWVWIRNFTTRQIRNQNFKNISDTEKKS